MQCIMTEKQSNQINTQWQSTETGSLLIDSQNKRQPRAKVLPAKDNHQAWKQCLWGLTINHAIKKELIIAINRDRILQPGMQTVACYPSRLLITIDCHSKWVTQQLFWIYN